MLTRHAIESGAYLSSLDSLPTGLRWSTGMIDQSMRGMLASREEEGDIWVFGYGSLIWNPLSVHKQRSAATLRGWHRQFCQRLLGGRADVDAPGRMLALCPGGQTQGVAYRLDADALDEELRLLWIREMAMGAYKPIWAPVQLEIDGRIVETSGLVFVANLEHPLHESNSDVETVAPLIAGASGPWGSNAEYVFSLAEALKDDGLSDPYIASLAERVGYRKAERIDSLGATQENFPVMHIGYCANNRQA